MGRLTTKDIGAAIRYLFQTRYPGLPASPNGSDHDFTNNIPLTWSDAADVTSIHGLLVDPDSRVRLDRETHLGARIPLQFSLLATGGLATETFFIAPRAMVITDVFEIHSTAETAAGTATAVVTHETGTQAPGAGTAVMTNTFNLKATANTVQTATLNAPTGSGDPNAALVLAQGDRLSITVGGTATITALAGVVLTVWVAPGHKENYTQFFMASSVATQAIGLFNRDQVVTAAYLVYSHAASGAPTITLDITQESGTTAPGSGTTILGAAQAVDNTTAVNTVYSLPLSGTAANLVIRAGNRLSIKSSGSWSGLAGVCVVVVTQAIGAMGYYGQSDAGIAILANGSVLTQGFLIADRDYEVVDWSAGWGTASGAAGTLDLTIDKGVVAPGAGSSALAGTSALSGTANTVSVPGVNTSRRQRLASRGDLISIKVGSPSATAGLYTGLSLLPR